MGEISDGLINGDFDFYTGEYLGRGFGIPRTKNKLLEWERQNKIKTNKDPKECAYNGIKKYISAKWCGRPDIPNVRELIKEYTHDSNFDLKQKCLEIQNDFGAFVKFINQKLKAK